MRSIVWTQAVVQAPDYIGQPARDGCPASHGSEKRASGFAAAGSSHAEAADRGSTLGRESAQFLVLN
jgi:hypothetical protein